MLSQTLFFALVSSAAGLSQHRDEAFLGVRADDASPQDEGVGPNLHFAPVSTTMKCTINLTLQYMVVFTALGVCRSYLDFQAQPYDGSAVQKALKHASETVFYAPMACLMFVGFRMRVLQLTKGEGNPPEYVQMAMQCVAYSILANTLLVLLIPLFVKGADVELTKEGEMKTDGANPFENQALAVTFTVIRYLAFLGLYAGFGIVVYGLFTFEPPAGVWDGPVPPLSPAVFCTCLLACAFFTCYCFVAISRTYSQFTQQKESKFEEVMLAAADTLAFAPMLCVLFLGARMRALQMDPVGGNPQAWAQNCFYLCAYSVLAQLTLVIVVPYVLGGEVRKGEAEGDVTFELANPSLYAVMSGVRYLLMLALYGGFTAVIVSVFTIEDKDDPEATPPISPAMQCVMNLTAQFFFVYLMLWVSITVKQFADLGEGLDIAITTFDSARATVQFCPMLSVLFLGLRLRALQLKPQVGAPQGWAQQGMFLCTYSLMIQVIMVLMLPLFTRGAPEMDADGNPKVQGTGILAKTLVAMRYIC